jgi:hypothetical protein
VADAGARSMRCDRRGINRFDTGIDPDPHLSTICEAVTGETEPFDLCRGVYRNETPVVLADDRVVSDQDVGLNSGRPRRVEFSVEDRVRRRGSCCRRSSRAWRELSRNLRARHPKVDSND